MKHETFELLLKEILKRTTSVLASKNTEYASDSDKLNNFKRAGKMLGCTPEKALIGMWAKHIISLLDIVDKVEQDNSEGMKKLRRVLTKEVYEKYYSFSVDIGTLEEKIGDAINYLILLEAMIKERYEK